jgi:hypothetical protein
MFIEWLSSLYIYCNCKVVSFILQCLDNQKESGVRNSKLHVVDIMCNYLIRDKLTDQTVYCPLNAVLNIYLYEGVLVISGRLYRLDYLLPKNLR